MINFFLLPSKQNKMHETNSPCTRGKLCNVIPYVGHLPDASQIAVKHLKENLTMKIPAVKTVNNIKKFIYET